MNFLTSFSAISLTDSSKGSCKKQGGVGMVGLNIFTVHFSSGFVILFCLMNKVS